MLIKYLCSASINTRLFSRVKSADGEQIEKPDCSKLIGENLCDNKTRNAVHLFVIGGSTQHRKPLVTCVLTPQPFRYKDFQVKSGKTKLSGPSHVKST